MLKRFVSEKKIPESQDKDLSDAIEAITYSAETRQIAGSASLKAFKYSSDVDLFEYFNSKYSAEDIAKALQQIVRQIAKAEIYYITDIKSGVNEDLNIFHRLGKIMKGKIIGFDSKDTQHQLETIKDKIDNYDDLITMCKSAHNGSITSWLELREGIRKNFTLRWTSKEVTQGYRLVDNQKILLVDCISQFVTKIDMIFSFDGTFTEISNILISDVSEKNGMTFLPIVRSLEEGSSGLKYSLFELIHSRPKNYLKMLKRTFYIAHMRHDLPMMKKIVPIFDSNIALLSKVNSIITTLIEMLETIANPPMIQIRKNIDECRTRLSNIYEFPFKERLIDIELVKAQNLSKDKTKELLEEIELMIQHIVNSESLHYIKKYKILPLPSRYLP